MENERRLASVHARLVLLEEGWVWIERLWLCVGAMILAVTLQWVGVLTRFYVLNVIGLAAMIVAIAAFGYCVVQWWKLNRAVDRLAREDHAKGW